MLVLNWLLTLGVQYCMLGTLVAMLCVGSELLMLDGVTFSDQRDVLYVRARQLSNAFELSLVESSGAFKLGGQAIVSSNTRRLADNTLLVRVAALKHHGFTTAWHQADQSVRVNRRAKAIKVRKGDQRVVVNKREMMLVAWQGKSVVFRSKVGIGRAANQTPTGIFKAQTYRRKMHLSSLYGDAPMPYAVQVVGNIFIHGSDKAFGRTSHGCIRLPVSGRNPARWFYAWIQPGTPVVLQGKWPSRASG